MSTLYKTQTAAVACVRPAWHTMVPERGEREREVSFTLLYLLKRCLCYKAVFMAIGSMNTVVAFRSCMRFV